MNLQFALIAHPRSGTTFFRSMLNANGAIFCYGEILYPDFFHWGFFSFLQQKVMSDYSFLLQTRWVDALDEYFSQSTGIMAEAGKLHIGYDLKIPQLNAFYNVFEFLTKADFGILHLVRKDKGKLACSELLMRSRMQAGIPVHSPNQLPNPQIEISRKWLLSRIAELTHGDRLIEDSLRDRHYLKFFYEDIVNPDEIAGVSKSLSSFFSEEVRLNNTNNYTKQTNDLSKIVTNYDEVCDLII
jgi:hypothetical protein